MEAVVQDYLLLFKQEVLVDVVVVHQDLTLLKEVDMLVVLVQTLHPIQVLQNMLRMVEQQYHYGQIQVVIHGLVVVEVVLVVLVLIAHMLMEVVLVVLV